MKILVCLKQIEQIYSRTGLDPDLNFLSGEDRIYRINPFDEAALELALRLKDAKDGTKIILLTIGELIAEKELRRCFALGADELYQVEIDSNSDHRIRSKVISKTAHMLGADIVLCGKESLDRRNGQVPAATAYMLGYPFLSSITELKFDQDTGRVSILRSCGKGVRERITCPLPALFSVDLGRIDIRMPRHEDLLKADSVTVRTLIFEEFNKDEDTAPRREFSPLPRVGKVRTPDSSLEAYKRIHLLLEGGSVEKDGRLVKGSPQEQVEVIIDFLLSNALI